MKFGRLPAAPPSKSTDRIDATVFVARPSLAVAPLFLLYSQLTVRDFSSRRRVRRVPLTEDLFYERTFGNADASRKARDFCRRIPTTERLQPQQLARSRRLRPIHLRRPSHFLQRLRLLPR